ncbi:G-protein coupled receptor Mth2-like [Aphomia sociella]
MIAIKLYFLVMFLCSVKSQNVSLCEDKTLIDVNGNVVEKGYCEDKPCIISRYKVHCLVVKRINTKKKACKPIKDISNMSNNNMSHFQEVYKKQFKTKIEKINRTFEESFHIVTYRNKNMYHKNCSGDWAKSDFVNNFLYFLEDGSILIDTPNSGARFLNIEKNDFIILMYAEEKEHGLEASIAFKVLHRNDETNLKGILVAVGMLLSCFFMILVIIVYAIVKELQNVFGLVVMAYMATFCGAFLLKAIQILGLWKKAIDVTTCIYLEPLVYFGILSSFMWMNVMSFDIWRKFRDTHYHRTLKRRNILQKFMYYALYAWLTPIILVIVEVVIDRADLSHLPNFTKPSFETCSFYSTSKIIYLLAPILVILIINTVLFCLTSFNMWRVRREMSRFNKNETKKNKKNENRFGIFLRLSLVMGTNWIFEIVGSLVNLPTWFEHLVDTYNVLVGVFIFFVFVFKKNIISKLSKRFSDYNSIITRNEDTGVPTTP